MPHQLRSADSAHPTRLTDGILSGALEHAGATLEASLNPQTRKVGAWLSRAAARASAEQTMDSKKAISQALRTEVTNFLNEHDVDSLLDTKAFLKL